MRSPGGYLTYLNSRILSQEEKDIISGFIEHRNTIRPTGIRTKGKQVYECVWICSILYNNGSNLHSATVKDILKVANAASDYVQNTRQTKIVTLKALANYIHRFHHPIENLDLLKDVKAGSASKNRKEALTLEEWDKLINLPMPARDRALLAVLYDGYHRPMEPLTLKWSDLTVGDRGIEYEILFKTEKVRTIVQKPETTEILEAWRRECGAKLSDNTFVFPPPYTKVNKNVKDGVLKEEGYQTITVLAKMFQRLKKRSGIASLKPSSLRTTAITHDVDAGLPLSYICLRAWGEPFNDLINLYTKPDSARIQRDQHDKAGMQPAILGKSGAFMTRDDRIADMERELRIMKEEQLLTQKHIKELMINRSD